MSSYLKDCFLNSEGNGSSKRLCGAILLINGICLKNGEYFMGIFREVIFHPEMLSNSSDSLLMAGTALLGFGVVELFAGRTKNKIKNENE